MSNTKKTQICLFILLGSVVALAGCSTQLPPAQSHDVKYYLQHRQERVDMLKKCANDAGTLDASPDCTNAATANQSDHGSI